MVQKKEYKCSTLLFDIAAHSTCDIISVPTIDGDIILLSADREITKLDTIKHHTDSCRRTLFSAYSEHLLSISSDQSFAIFDIETRGLVKAYEDAHESAVYSICEVRENIYATGDDEGVIKLWDKRKDGAIMTEPEHGNFISSLAVDSTGSTLLAASGDGRLSVWNSRQRKLIARSDECDSELLTCTILRNGSKVLCGDAEGVLNVFSWGNWGDISDRVPVQTDVSVDVVMKYSDEVVVLGCMDGVIRATTIFPHIPLTHVGDHDDNSIEGLCLTHDEAQILSVGQDYVVRAWPTKHLEENIAKALKNDDDDDDDEEDGEDSDSDTDDEKPQRKKLKHMSAKELKSKEAADFFSDLS